MNSRQSNPARRTSGKQQGSALITVVFFVGIMAILTVSMLKYSASEQRGNERNRLILRAKNMAENIAIYSAEQLTTKLYRLGSTPSGVSFPWTGTSRNRVFMPPDSVLNTGFTSASVGMESRCAILSASGYAPVTDTTDPNYGLHVSTAIIPIIAKATASHPSLGSVTAYVEQDMNLALTPLFQFGIFYNMDLELFPGQNMSIIGPVHTNGRLMARGEVGGSATLTFNGRVTAAEGLYADGQMKATYIKRAGDSSSGTGGTGAVNYTATNGTQTNLYGSSTWRDHKWGGSSETSTTQNQFKVFATNTYTGNVRTNVHGVTKLELPAIGTYKEVNDASTPEDDRNNGRQIIDAPNPKKFITSAWVSTTDDAEAQQSKISWRAGLYIVVNPDDDARSATLPNGTSVSMVPRSYRCWLNTINSDGTHTMSEVILPGQPAYGYNDNGTPSNPADDYMYANNLPNRYNTSTAVGSNQVLRIPVMDVSRVKYYNGTAWVSTTAGTGALPNLPTSSGYSTTWPTPSSNYVNFFPIESSTTPYPADAYFYDLRRANGNVGLNSTASSSSSRSASGGNYIPRPITKIDFDMTRFKMSVERTMGGTAGSYSSSTTTSTVYNVGVPGATNWTNSIYNPSGTATATKLGLGGSFDTYPTATTLAAADPFRMYAAPANPIDSLIATNPGSFALGSGSLVSTSSPCPWYDGIAIYIHSVDAEVRSQTSGVPDRLDSGVRLWNGRGPVISLSATGKTGFTLATNDAAYIIGHFNADGSVNSTTASSGNGGYSARWPDSSNEKLCAVMADAITLLSQPVFTNSGYYQTKGWNDALSGFRVTSTSWSTNWRSSNPSSGNQFEGLDGDSIKPGDMPNYSDKGTNASASVKNAKLPPDDTEFSTALLMGLVPSNHNASTLSDRPPIWSANGAYSGGAHNFPRLLEDWHCDMGDGNTAGLFIRGSMVALFESRVAMEPYTLRYYQAPTRYWGLHEGFATAAHDLPLEPIVLSSTRVGFRELSPADYAAMKSQIEALTALP